MAAQGQMLMKGFADPAPHMRNIDVRWDGDTRMKLAGGPITQTYCMNDLGR